MSEIEKTLQNRFAYVIKQFNKIYSYLGKVVFSAKVLLLLLKKKNDWNWTILGLEGDRKKLCRMQRAYFNKYWFSKGFNLGDRWEGPNSRISRSNYLPTYVCEGQFTKASGLDDVTLVNWVVTSKIPLKFHNINQKFNPLFSPFLCSGVITLLHSLSLSNSTLPNLNLLNYKSKTCRRE